MTEFWVLDASASEAAREVGMLAFCPFDPETGDVAIGLTMLTDYPPGKWVGVIHADGQQECDEWCADNPAVIASLEAKRLEQMEQAA